MASPTLRKLLLDGVADLVDARFGAAGTVGKWLREVRKGPLRPLGPVKPVATISDGGQRRVEEEEPAGSMDVITTIVVTLQLEINWERVAEVEDWTDRVERIIETVGKEMIAGCGLITLDYVDDDPVDVVFTSGASNAAWAIVFEARRFVDA